MTDPINIVISWFSNWGRNNSSSRVKLVFCFGSVGRGEATTSSDVDLCIVCNNVYIQELLDELNISFPLSLCYEKPDKHKFFALLRPVGDTNSVIRVDAFVSESLLSVESFIIGSEMSLKNENLIVIYNNEETGVECREMLRSTISFKSPKPPIFVVRDMVMNFIESFEVASHKRAIGDKFQFFFQIVLAYISLVKLEYIRQGGCKFLYLPKMVFPSFDEEIDSVSGLSVRRIFEDRLEPSGKLNDGYVLQAYKIAVTTLFK